MKNLRVQIYTGLLFAAANNAALAQTQTAPQPPAGNAVPVTADNFKPAETDMYFAMFTKQGGFGKFEILRDLPLENTGVRPNRDTLYSLAVFDLDAGPVTITMPDAGNRFMSLLVIDQDHYAREVAYGAGRHTYTRQQIGTRYLFMGVRILVDPADPQDIKQVHALQIGCPNPESPVSHVIEPGLLPGAFHARRRGGSGHVYERSCPRDRP